MARFLKAFITSLDVSLKQRNTTQLLNTIVSSLNFPKVVRSQKVHNRKVS